MRNMASFCQKLGISHEICEKEKCSTIPTLNQSQNRTTGAVLSRKVPSTETINQLKKLVEKPETLTCLKAHHKRIQISV